MEYKVTGCKDCPFLNNDREYGDRCHHPTFLQVQPDGSSPSPLGKPMEDDLCVDVKEKYKTSYSMWTILTPDWCPLTEPITIKKDDTQSTKDYAESIMGQQ